MALAWSEKHLLLECQLSPKNILSLARLEKARPNIVLTWLKIFPYMAQKIIYSMNMFLEPS